MQYNNYRRPIDLVTLERRYHSCVTVTDANKGIGPSSTQHEAASSAIVVDWNQYSRYIDNNRSGIDSIGR
jgi:hypothetical protein